MHTLSCTLRWEHFLYAVDFSKTWFMGPRPANGEFTYTTWPALSVPWSYFMLNKVLRAPNWLFGDLPTYLSSNFTKLQLLSRNLLLLLSDYLSLPILSLIDLSRNRFSLPDSRQMHGKAFAPQSFFKSQFLKMKMFVSFFMKCWSHYFKPFFSYYRPFQVVLPCKYWSNSCSLPWVWNYVAH